MTLKRVMSEIDLTVPDTLDLTREDSNGQNPQPKKKLCNPEASPAEAELERCVAKIKAYRCCKDDFKGMTSKEIETAMYVYAERCGVKGDPDFGELLYPRLYEEISDENGWRCEGPPAWPSMGSDNPKNEYYGELAYYLATAVDSALDYQEDEEERERQEREERERAECEVRDPA